MQEKDGLQQSKERQQILDMVSQYAKRYHVGKAYKKGDRINYAGRVYDQNEMVALVDSALEFWLTSGHYTAQFEEDLAKYLGITYCSLVNSGSSANLLAFMALTSPLLGRKAIMREDEVITVAAGFPTTVAPIVQFGAVPVFVDVTIPEYNIDVSQLEVAYSEKTRAVMIAHTLGNPFDLSAVKAFCDKHDLWLIEDNCDALGSKYILEGKECYTGTVGDISTSSFYPPHHITMGEGGAVYTNNSMLHTIIRSMRDWGRDCSCPSGVDNLCRHRFDGQYGELPKGYDHKYVYSHFGYNLKATDMQAAIGVEQLKKFPEFCQKRRGNFDTLYKLLEPIKERIVLPRPTENAEPCWFGFMLTCKENGERDRIVNFLEDNGVQTRMLFAGNMVKQPCFGQMREDGQGYRTVGDLENTDRIMKNSFWIGVYPGMTGEMIEYMAEKIREFYNEE